jgi:hypothetical protein
MAPRIKENIWGQLLRYKNAIDRFKIENSSNEKERDEWRVLHQHSAAKISKTIAEHFYAPNSLPPEMSQRLNERIESSRNQLLKILKEHNDSFANDLPFVIQ